MPKDNLAFGFRSPTPILGSSQKESLDLVPLTQPTWQSVLGAKV